MLFEIQDEIVKGISNLWKIYEYVCFIKCGQKRGHILNLKSSGEAAERVLQTPRPKPNHIEWSEIKTS